VSIIFRLIDKQGVKIYTNAKLMLKQLGFGSLCQENCENQVKSIWRLLALSYSCYLHAIPANASQKRCVIAKKATKKTVADAGLG